MSDDFLGVSSPSRTLSSNENKEKSKELIKCYIDFRGFNEDIVESYYWHINFAYFIGKGYKAVKLEDHHHFSENSQYGQNFRQIKGGSIRAFQENLQQMIQLIKVHMMPLLKEVKQSEFYKEWIDKIVVNDDTVQSLKAKGVPNNDPRILRARRERNEAINHIKDKWVNEVDGGRMWQMNRPATEQGLDFALLPQLFFAINLDNPLVGLRNTGPTITEQLESDVYPVDITEQAKEQVARFMFRFYNWLPTAIKETQTTFKIKVSALRQFYAQLQMYANFMKPLLLEIARKNESLENENFYRDYTAENPEFITLFDYSYSFVKLAGIRNFERHGYSLKELDFSDRGFYIKPQDGNGNTILAGQFKGKGGYIIGADGKKDSRRYKFIPCSPTITDEEYRQLREKWKENKTYLNKIDLRTFPVMIIDFRQKRRNQMMQTQQGPQPMPFMQNQITYKGYTWNLFEIASYRDSLKDDNIDLLATFISEIDIIKEDLKKYVGMVHGIEEIDRPETTSNNSNSSKKQSPFEIVFAPIQGIGELFSPLLPNFHTKAKEKQQTGKVHGKRDNAHLVNQLMTIEDVWKMYTVHKKTKGFMQF